MKLQITIEMDNAAFDGCNGQEVARILRRLAGEIDGATLGLGETSNLRDFNGNWVGRATVTDV